MNISGRTKRDPAELQRFRELAAIHINGDGRPNAKKIAREMGKPRQTIQDWIKTLDTAPKIEFPAFVIDGDEDESILDILDRKAKHFERKAKAQADREWFAIKVNETKPYGVLLFGDPHLDDDGANIPLLKRHLAIASRPGVYCLNIGDTTNNWV